MTEIQVKYQSNQIDSARAMETERHNRAMESYNDAQIAYNNRMAEIAKYKADIDYEMMKVQSRLADIQDRYNRSREALNYSLISTNAIQAEAQMMQAKTSEKVLLANVIHNAAMEDFKKQELRIQSWGVGLGMIGNSLNFLGRIGGAAIGAGLLI